MDHVHVLVQSSGAIKDLSEPTFLRWISKLPRKDHVPPRGSVDGKSSTKGVRRDVDRTVRKNDDDGQTNVEVPAVLLTFTQKKYKRF